MKVIPSWCCVPHSPILAICKKHSKKKNITPISAEVEWIPSTTVPVNDEQAEEVSKLIEKLEQDDDVQKVFHNMQ